MSSEARTETSSFLIEHYVATTIKKWLNTTWIEDTSTSVGMPNLIL